MQTRYPAMLKPDGDGFAVQFVDLEESFTEGSTVDEALFNAAEVLTLTLEGRIEEGQPVPEPTQGLAGAHYIAPDAKAQAALLVRRARGGRSLAELARAMETSWPCAERLENPSHWPSLKQLEKAASALGRRLVLTFE